MDERIEEARQLVATESDSTGLFEIQIINPGVGSSGVYLPSVLEAAGRDRVFPAGTHMYLNHPTETEQAERPERDVRDLAGALVEDARWNGTALVAKARVYSMYRPLLAEAAQDIGVSIRARAEVHEGIHEGAPARMIDRLIEGYSIDYVTNPGRGGAVLSVLESARTQLLANETTATVPSHPAGHTTEGSQEDSMDEITEAKQALSEAQNRVAALEAQLVEAATRAETAEADRDKATAALSAHTLKAAAASRAQESVKDLPEAMAGRILESVTADLPTLDDGHLDEAAFDTKLADAVKAEQDYAAAVAPKGLTGFGASTQANESNQTGPRRNAWGREIKEA